MREFKTVLFPVDLLESSGKIVPDVQSVAEKFNSKIHLLFVARVFDYFTGIYVPAPSITAMEKEIIDGAEKRLDEFVEQYFSDYPDTVRLVVPGDATDKIIEYITSNDKEFYLMGIENLDKIFQPNSIAVVGASDRKGSVGAALMHNLIEPAFPGKIYPINPKHRKIWGKPTCPTIADLKDSVDLAILATPIMTAPQIVKECATAGVVIISAGGKEIGEEGKKVEAAIRKEAEASLCNYIFGHILGTGLIGDIAFEIGLAVVTDAQRI